MWHAPLRDVESLRREMQNKIWPHPSDNQHGTLAVFDTVRISETLLIGGSDILCFGACMRKRQHPAHTVRCIRTTFTSAILPSFQTLNLILSTGHLRCALHISGPWVVLTFSSSEHVCARGRYSSQHAISVCELW